MCARRLKNEFFNSYRKQFMPTSGALLSIAVGRCISKWCLGFKRTPFLPALSVQFTEHG